jgi:hypothetical protein
MFREPPTMKSTVTPYQKGSDLSKPNQKRETIQKQLSKKKGTTTQANKNKKTKKTKKARLQGASRKPNISFPYPTETETNIRQTNVCIAVRNLSERKVVRHLKQVIPHARITRSFTGTVRQLYGYGVLQILQHAVSQLPVYNEQGKIKRVRNQITDNDILYGIQMFCADIGEVYNIDSADAVNTDESREGVDL